MEGYPVPADRINREIFVKNSRFISDLGPASDLASAEGFIAEIERAHPDATHHVPAYIIGYGASKISHASDDGEPSGTAGRPALAVLEGSGLGDVVVVITRYFGGTKLGTGGLVRAYSDAVRIVVENVPRARKVPVYVVHFSISYPLYEKILRIVNDIHGLIADEKFTEIVSLTAKIPAVNFPAFERRAMEISSGSINLQVIDKNQYAFIPQDNAPTQDR